MSLMGYIYFLEGYSANGMHESARCPFPAAYAHRGVHELSKMADTSDPERNYHPSDREVAAHGSHWPGRPLSSKFDGFSLLEVERGWRSNGHC